MGLFAELRGRMPQVLFPTLGLAAIGYFAWHGISGDRGLLAWRTLEQQAAVERAEVERVRAERETLERRVSLLYSDSLDRDMLDEWSRRLLNYGHPDEVVIFHGDDDRR